jgi:hypothetical protein
MISEITFSTSKVTDSITNSSSINTLDNIQPLSFLEFITNTNVDYSPEEYNNFYIDYLKQWSDIKNSTSSTKTVNYIELYTNFLKELVVTYSTQSELRFFSTLNFNDPVELDIAIPLYVEKLRQVILFYKEKRDNIKYVVDKNKIKGNSTSIEKAIFERIYDYIFSTEQQPQYTLLNLSLSAIISDMKIDIEEFVDVYGNYFDLPRVNEDQGTLRDDLYNSNINDIDIDLFFKTSDAQNVLQSKVFLLELPLAVNYSTTVDLICDPTNPLLLIDTQANVCGLTVAEKDSLKRELISKYIGVDFYYISTINNTLCADKFITAQNPTANIPNLQTADTATVQSNEVKLLRDLGLFFKPDTIGLFQLNSNNFTFSVDASKLESDKIYIFPDPNVYGNVSLNKQDVYPLVYIHDYTKDVKNISSGLASGDPKVSNYEQTFTPYFSKEQSTLKNVVDNTSLNLNFSDLYNKGYITKIQYDIYGNEYALFKDEFGHTFKTITDNTNEEYILDLQLDGHVFYDIIEGYNFDYSIVGEEYGSIRSGISARTINEINAPTFTLSGTPYTLFFREFTPYDELITLSRNIQGKFRDAGSFTFEDNSSLPDPTLADSPSYPSVQPYYYTELVDAGVSSLTPITRAFIGVGGSNGDFALDVKTVYSNLNVEDYDCGYFTDIIELTNDFNYEINYPYFDTVDANSSTVVSSVTGSNLIKTQAYKRKLQGNLFVKNQRSSLSYPVSAALNIIYKKYNSSVISEIYTGIKDFDVVYDTIVCETNSYLVFDKIKYDENGFLPPATKNTFFTRNSAQPINKFSNRFFNEKDKTLTFCVINEVITDINHDQPCLSGSNYKILLPQIYQYNIPQNTVTNVFPRGGDVEKYAVSLFSIRNQFDSSFNINIIKVDKPIISYNSLNCMYKLTYTCTDSNNMAYIFDINFSINNDRTTFGNSKFYKQNKLINTSNFYSLTSNYPNTLYVSVNTLDGAIIKDNGTIIL